MSEQGHHPLYFIDSLHNVCQSSSEHHLNSQQKLQTIQRAYNQSTDVIFINLQIGIDIRLVLNLDSGNTSFSKTSETIMDEFHVRK